MSTASLRREVEKIRARTSSTMKEVPSDPVELAKLSGYQPDEWQLRLLRSSANRILINASRQSGKSSMAAVIAMHKALREPGSTVLVLSPALRQSAELFRKCSEIYSVIGRPIPATSETRLTLSLSNGSRVLSLPGRTGDTVRGYAADLLICDEASRISDELYASVRPMMATTNGRLIALSTPAGRRGWWMAAWHFEEGWERYRIPWHECERIDPGFIAEERKTLPLRLFEQEYECVFHDNEEQLFATELIQSAVTERVSPLSILRGAS